MFQSLSALASLTVSSIGLLGKLKGRGRKRKAENLARALYLVYFRLNDCLVTGGQIVDVLEAFCRCEAGVSYSGRHHVEAYGLYLDDLLARQAQQLLSLSDSVESYAEFLRIIDADLYLKVKQFTAFKGAGVDWLAGLFSEGRIPFDSLSLDDANRLASFARYMLAPEEGGTPEKDPLRGMIEDFAPWYGQVGDVADRMSGLSLIVEEMFDPEGYQLEPQPEKLDALRTLLARNDFRHHLIEAKDQLTALRKFIGENFSLVDVMLDVGSEQLRRRPIW